MKLARHLVDTLSGERDPSEYRVDEVQTEFFGFLHHGLTHRRLGQASAGTATTWAPSQTAVPKGSPNAVDG